MGKIVKGTVFLNYKRDEANILYVEISEDTHKALASEIDITIDNPLKCGFDDTEGKEFFKCKSKYNVGVYNNGEPSGLHLSEIGRGSVVEVDVKILEGKFKGKKYVSAYLKNINVLELVEAEEYNPFTH